MSKTFDTVNIHKLTLTNIPNIIIKFIANYTKGQQACTQYNSTLSKLKRINTKYHKVEFCLQHYSTFTPLTFHLLQKTYKSQHMLITLTITASHTKHRKAQQIIQPYLHKIYEWAITNNLHINTDKTTTTLFTPDPPKYSTTLSLKLNQTFPIKKHVKIFGIALDPKLIFSQHINVTITKAKQMLNILKALTVKIIRIELALKLKKLINCIEVFFETC